MFKGLFHYESKFYQLLVKGSYLVLLNVLYLICCLPIFTIGAAQAGMMNAARVMQNPTDDSSCFQAFFRGFRSGFGRITAVWSVCGVVIAAMVYLLMMVIYFDAIWANAPTIPAIIGLAVGMMMQAMAAAFHSRFDCTLWQIVRSSWYMMLMHPIRAICMTAVVWGPVIIALLDLYLFFQVTPLWLFIYFAIAFQFSAKLMEAPFQKVEDQYAPNKDGCQEEIQKSID